MTKKKSNQKVRWQRNFFLLKYPDGKFVSLTTHQTLSLPKPVSKDEAYLFTPSKADVYLAQYKEQFDLVKISVNVYLE